MGGFTMSETGVLEKGQLEVAQETDLELEKGVAVVSSDEEDIDEDEIEDFEPDEEDDFGDDNDNEEFAEDFLPEDFEEEVDEEDLLEDFEPDEE